VVHALWVWGVAEVLGAAVLLRMEDHDRIRCRPEFEHSILADLAWLGFEAEPGSATSLTGRGSPYRQSDVPERYAEAFARLAAATDVYGCSCTRAQLGPADADHERRYPGTCRGMPLDREGRCAIRAHLSEGTVATTDLRLGVLVEDPQATCGDIVVRDALGQWTYQFSVVVDDLFHGVDLVVRGEDLVHSTARQAVLGRLLGREQPVITVHHPLVVDPDGRKLSKRDRSLTIRAMREGGKTAAQVIDEACGLAGLSTVE
jgi:glutamyl-tRNA synthetase/glutamyl-Q tRNA(Asp) synthetase